MKLAALACALAAVATAASAEPTHVMVRAQALDAKFIGDHMGGVQITLRDVRSGRTLASGVTKGETGDTPRIMKTPHARGAALSDAATAGYQSTLDIDEPTLVEAEAVGPLGKPAAKIRVTSRLWIFPGRDVTGNGWLLTFPGLVVEPNTEALSAAGPKVSTKVTLMCGCPIEPGGLWNAENYAVEAQLRRGPHVVARTPLAYAGAASTFAGALPAVPPGRYRLRVTAADRSTPNAGLWEDWVQVR